MTPTEVKKLNKNDLVEYAESLGVKGDFETLTKAEIQKLISEDADYSEAAEEVKEDAPEQPEEGTDESDEELLEDSETPEEEAVQEDSDDTTDSEEDADEVSSDAENDLLAEIVSMIQSGKIGQRAGAGFYRTDPEGKRTLMMNVHRVVYNAAAAAGFAGLVEAADHPHHTIEAGCAVYNARQHGQVYLRCNSSSKMYLLKCSANLNEGV